MLPKLLGGRIAASRLCKSATSRRCFMATSTTSGPFKFAAIQLAVTADKDKTLAHARDKIREAAKSGAKVIALPECFNCPYGTKYFPAYCETIPDGPTTKMLEGEAKANNIFLIGGSFPERDGDKLYNTSLSFGPDGAILGKHRKVHLFDIDIPGKMTFKESESLSAGNSFTVFDTPYCRIGVAICYDIRFAELSMIMAQQKGCKMLVFPGAFNMTTGPLHWELLMRARAIDNQCFVSGVSPARDTTADYIAWGHSSIVNPWAEVIAKADEKEAIIYADIDLQKIDDIRNGIPIMKQKRTDLYSLVDKTSSSH